VHKSSLYARAGVADSWIVDVGEGLLEVYRQPVRSPDAPYGWRYAAVERLGRGEAVSPLALPGATVAVASLLGSPTDYR